MQKLDSLWIKKNHYYYKKLEQFYKFTIPEKQKVLQICCKSGYILNSVNPYYGLGIDADKNYIEEAQKVFSNKKNLEFKNIKINDLEPQKFDYIIISHVLMREYDIQNFLEHLQNFCDQNTRIVINICSWVWEPIIKIGQKIKFCRNEPFENENIQNTMIKINDPKNSVFLFFISIQF